MLILLPPSETKRDGGDGRALDTALLRFPGLSSSRNDVVDTLVSLAADETATVKALKLGPKQLGEVQRNRVAATSATMPAIDRYTGVLYDALEADTLSADARRFAAEHLVVHSALLGPVGALDPIPAYRLSHDSRLPGFVLKRHWAGPVARELNVVPGVLLDLRSEGYAALGPLPDRVGAVYLRVLTVGDDGRRRALNHFNKQGKGRFTRALLEAGVDHPDVDSLLDWARSTGWVLDVHARADDGRATELALVV
ncbi:YaaA family protein [Plantibacter sp. CFBP 13570]|uniref:YaaA family protein n=1 Tax=Plantibacter sp. CFBP 13570 TaxID=2775272 RepID=UPI001930B7A0|nr:peroxide stress protein YaaA [Plantibacter sp. CFBP 13570]MBD8535271.1 peroxide stress protein YaaA [Plantibacter sp. CFBP 13570]